MSFNNPGGSIGSGLLVLLAGWCIHCVAKHLAAQSVANKAAPGATTAARQAGRLSERSFRFLVRLLVQWCSESWWAHYSNSQNSHHCRWHASLCHLSCSTSEKTKVASSSTNLSGSEMLYNCQRHWLMLHSGDL